MSVTPISKWTGPQSKRHGAKRYANYQRKMKLSTQNGVLGFLENDVHVWEAADQSGARAHRRSTEKANRSASPSFSSNTNRWHLIHDTEEEVIHIKGFHAIDMGVCADTFGAEINWSQPHDGCAKDDDGGVTESGDHMCIS